MLSIKNYRHGAVAAAIFVLFAVMFAASVRATEENLKVENAWVRMAAPSATATAAYFTLINSGSEARQLVAAESGSFEKAEIHVSKVSNGVATMHPVAQVDVPAKGSVAFAQGGLHVMLIGPKAPLAEGAKVEFGLVFADGARLPVTALVKKGGAAGGHTH